MNRRFAGVLSIAFIIICIGYIIYDISTGRSDNIVPEQEITNSEEISSNWYLESKFHVDYGILNAVKVTENNEIICAGNSFIALYDRGI